MHVADHFAPLQGNLYQRCGRSSPVYTRTDIFKSEELHKEARVDFATSAGNEIYGIIFNDFVTIHDENIDKVS